MQTVCHMAEVYALEHPDTGQTFYIGSTTGSAKARLTAHLSRYAAPRIRRWAKLLKAQGKKPRLVILAVTTPKRAAALELHLIGSDTNLLNTRLENSADPYDTDHMVDD